MTAAGSAVGGCRTVNDVNFVSTGGAAFGAGSESDRRGTARASHRVHEFCLAVALRFDLCDQPDPGQETDRPIGRIEFPPTVSMRSRNGVCVVIVVPPFAACEQGDQPAVATIIASRVIPVSPHMSD